jgi:colicin import membrane protein
MNTRTHVKLRPQVQLPTERRAVGISVFLSVLFHAAVIAALVVAPMPSGGHRLAPGAVSVRLVSSPGPSAGGGQSAAPTARPLPQPITAKPEALERLPTVPLPEPVPEPIVKPAPVEVNEPPKVVSLAPAPKPGKPKTSLKKKTKDPSKIIKGAIERIKKGADKPQEQPPSVNAALERIKKQVAESEARQHEPYRPQSSGSTGTGAGSPGGGGGGGGAITLVDIYRGEVATQIQKNWAFSKQLGGDAAGLEAKIEFKVLPSGEIADIQFNTRSNNAYFDDSAYKAIVKSNPVAPHPRGVSKSYVMVGLRFTPEGIR